jgi:3-deoxy-7-phosphoheptulonate synthase
MIVVIEPKATEEQIESIIQRLNSLGFDIHRSTGASRTVIGVIGETSLIDTKDIRVLPGVSEVYKISEPFKLVSRHFQEDDTRFEVNDVVFGGKDVVVISGPCAVETRDQVMEIARAVKKAGAKVLRGGAFKPRTSPYSFQGLGEKGLALLKEAGEKFDMPVITEVIDKGHIEMVREYADIFQVGARNMQNYELLKALGKEEKPVFLKRGISATIEEWLLSAEYVLSNGNKKVILCERGIRTYETYTRNTLDLNAIPVIKKLSHLPVFVDPSHGTGIRAKVIPMSRAGIAAGADGLMIEVHNEPEKALSDGAQSLYPEQFEELMKQLKIIVKAIDRRI